MNIFRYSEWDGSQEDTGPNTDGLMDELGRNLMSYGDLSYSLRLMQQRGFIDGQGRRMPSIQQMMERLRQRKQEQLRRYNLDNVMGDIREKLDEIIRTEREGIAARLDSARTKTKDDSTGLDPEVRQRLLKTLEDRAQQNLEKLDDLPPDTPGKIKALTGYDFMDDDARKQFEELLEMLKKHAMQSYGRDLLNQVKNLDPESLARMRHMVEALNQMLEQRMKGEEPDFEGFMREFGDFFGPNPPRNLDELIERMQQQIAQAQSLMNSLSPEDRAELQKILQSMVDDTTQFELARLSSYLNRMYPLDMIENQYPFSGDESISYNEAMNLMEELQKMDRLESQLTESRFDRTLDNVDEKLVRELLGEDEAENLDRLKDMERQLEEAGYIRKNGDGWELTPRGMRKIGEQALRDIFAQLNKDRLGGHRLNIRGTGGERIEETKPYEFGDDFNLHLQKTIMNSVYREPGRIPIRLTPDDFEVYRTEETTRSATVLLLDMSLSMPMRGNFEAAKRVTLALDNLIRSQYPRDTLRIVGFSSYARELKKENVTTMSWDEFDPYTNLQHGLHLARKLLDKERTENKQIILVSDGEPTAHFENDQLFFQMPPTMRTIQLTMREVQYCTRKGITINIFMLDGDPFYGTLHRRFGDLNGERGYRRNLQNSFVTRMAQLNKGRVFYANPDNLGEYMLVDYIANKRKKY
ncbi:MAG: VWA domain-containing protein [Dehalococcoidales bacterium]|nr:VWA domain-containing protein [Dehalococcoidales bacterium]